jgi:cytochrome c biogenesis protein CcmG/thiol:disulfide interchange protein DsbE
MKPLVLGLLVLLLAAACGAETEQASAPEPPSSSGAAPASEPAAPSEGGRTALDAYGGEPLVVNVWASWCPKCRSVAGEYAKWVAANPDVTFVGLDILDEPDAAVGFLAEYGWDWPQIADPSQELAGSLGLAGHPAVAAVDADGNVVARQIGVGGREEWEELLAALG